MITLNPIGIIHTPYTQRDNMPIQPVGAVGVLGTIEIDEPYRAGLQDLDGFSHIILLYVFHRSNGFAPLVKPFMDTQSRGVFATRAPRRPNPIGLSIVQLNRIEDGVLYVQNVDMLDGTPLLDIKPYVSDVDAYTETRVGWLETVGTRFAEHTSDDRFREGDGA